MRYSQLETFLISHPQLRTTFEEQWWNLNGYRLTPEWEHVLSLLNNTTVKRLQLDCCLKPTIVRQLSHIQFRKLNYLDLNSNIIASVEDLYFLRAPLLQSLQLSHNHLTRVRPLSRCQFPHLKYLYLNENPLVDVESLVEMQTEIEELGLELYYGDEVLAVELVWASKLPELKKLWIKAPKRIERRRINEMLKAMSPELEVEVASD